MSDIMKGSEPPNLKRPPILQELSYGFSRQKFLPTLVIGSMAGVLEVVLAVSFATLIYTEALADFVLKGIGLFLLANVIFLIIVTLFSSQPGSIAAIQSIPVAILAVVAGAVAGGIKSTAAPNEIFITVVAATGLTALLTGIFFSGLGRFKLGNLVRFLPYSVVGGFLAGTGWLLIVGAVSTMVGQPTDLSVFQTELLLRWLPGLLFALTILYLLNRYEHPMVLPIAVILGSLVFYGIAFLAKTPTAVLSTDGWLLGPFPSGRLWQPLALADLKQVRWEEIGRQFMNVGSVLVMSTVALLLNVSALEIATRREIDLNQELKVAGAANILVGLTGGMVGFQQLSISTINVKTGLDNRLTGLISGIVCAVALFFGASVLALFPRMILGGLLFYLGLTFLKEWIIDAWSHLPRLDYAVVLLILLVTAVIGFLEAVSVGLIVAILLFVINYSQISVVHHELSGRTQHSRVTRTLPEQDFLDAKGDLIYILRLQGFIFFGTADRLVNRIQQRIGSEHLPRVQFVLFDFQRVTAADTTTRLSFQKLAQLAQANQFTLVLTDVSPQIQQQLTLPDIKDNDCIQIFPDLDRGLAWCEEQILEAHHKKPTEQTTLEQRLLQILPEPEKIRGLLPHFTRLALPVGSYLIRQGDAPDALYFIESGQVTAQLEDGEHDSLRLQTMGGGHVVGEIGFYRRQKRTAAVITDKPSVIYQLTLETMQKMEKEDPEAASVLHQIVIHLLAARVTHLVDAVDALQR